MREGWYVSIRGKAYTVVQIRGGDGARKQFRMYNESDLQVYDIAVTEHGPVCDCADWEFRRINSGTTCKHINSLLILGLVTPEEVRFPLNKVNQ